ncbi:MAG TPA: OsmC family protein [Nitrolancea sp.]
MQSDELRALQAPLKAQYREQPESAVYTLTARGTLDLERIACRINTRDDRNVAGLHRATGGDGSLLCSGDMLLEALVACAGVTLASVATAISLPITHGTISAEGDLDFRGTLGVSRDTPTGFRDIRLHFDLQTDASEEQVAKLIQLTERYCVVFQTLNTRPNLSVTHAVRDHVG